VLYDDRYAYPGEVELVACARCGHRWLDFAPADVRALYADYYPRRELELADVPARRAAHGLRAWWRGERAAAAAWVPPEVAVLDVGCGTGEALAYHRDRGCKVRGVEADAHAVRIARARGLSVDHGAFDPALHAPASYDVVTLDQVLEHFVDPVAALRGVHTVLRPGGTAIVATPNAASAIARIAGDRWIHWHAPYHLHLFSRASLAQAAEHACLAIVEIRTITNSEWLSYQWIHALTRPPRGTRSTLWDPGARDPVIRAMRALRFFGGEAAVTRICDALGTGDNFLARLRRP
jgi:2-polyprenyl-3-methyl-5-hydroxy-6-metoxy-1,4-benzoquinol methylase